MVQLFKLGKDNRIHHLIMFADESVIRNDDYVSIEIGDGFDWYAHARNCIDCKAFFNSIGTSKFAWALESDGEFFLIDMSEFAKEDHFKNQIQLTVGDPKKGVRLKLKKNPLDKKTIEKLLAEYESRDDYESCSDLKNLGRLLKNQ